MKFVTRKRSVDIVLGAEQSKRFLLPPMTGGVIQILVQAVFRGDEAEPPDDGFGTPPPLSFDSEVVGNPSADLGNDLNAGNGPWVVMAVNNPLGPIDPRTGQLDADGWSVDSNPSPDVMIELKRIRKTIKPEPIGGLIHGARGDSADWNIIITRKRDVSAVRRRFRVVVIYPSVLPEEERRVPIAFLNRGFDFNFNEPQSGVQYVRSISITESNITYFLEPVFAALYGLDSEGTYAIPHVPVKLPWQLGGHTLLNGRLKCPTIHSVAPIEVRADIDTETDMAIGGPRFYLALKIKMRCEASRKLEFEPPTLSALNLVIPPGTSDYLASLVTAELPREFEVEARFYLQFLEGGGLYYVPRISTTLSVDFLPGVDDSIHKGINGALRDAERVLSQRGSLFDRHVKSWLVGNYELTGIRVDMASSELVLTHAGRPVKKPIANQVDPDAPQGIGWNIQTYPRPVQLVKTEGEFWDTEPPAGGEGGRLRPATNPGALAKIDHIVVLMMENRSFDHVLGHLSRDLGHDEVEGLLPGDNERNLNVCDRPDYRDEGTNFYPERITDTTWPVSLHGPCHGHHCTMRQMADGMKNFVVDFSDRAPTRTDAQRVMNYFGDGVLKAYDGLKRHFAICDHWFGSHIGGTFPNRHICFSGDLNRDRLGAPEEENSEMATYYPSERKTFFDLLTDKGVTWRLYEHGYSFLRMYRKYTFEQDRVRPFDEFRKAAEEGFLPSVSFIEPDYIEAPGGNDDHAPADMIEGQRLIANTVKALINGKRWDKTLLIVTYDEHGGFYDHLTPPDRIGTKLPDGTVETRPIPPLANGIRQLGPRVPAFVISPYTPGERPNPDGPNPPSRLNVAKSVFEHASIPATILRRFCSPRPAFLSHRVDAANDVRELLSLPADQPRLKAEFAELLAALQVVIDARPNPPQIHRPRLDGLIPSAPDAKEDFHGAIAYASAMSGRGLA